MTLPEVLLWQRLRGGQAGPKFRRQHPIGPYIADFYCVAARLVIEVDGEIHAGRTEQDRDRDRFLRENGYEVLRLRAADVLKNVDVAAEAIASLAARPLHHRPAAGGPPPRAGEDLQ
jgi:very-short-patch-repair endonuclease